MDLVPLLVISAGVVAVLAGMFSLRVSQPWRGLLWVVGFASGACFTVPVFLFGLSQVLFYHYPETVSQARDVMEAHAAELNALHGIADARPYLCNVDSRWSLEFSLCRGVKPDAHRDAGYARDYMKATNLLTSLNGGGLRIERDRDTRALTMIAFALSDPGIFGFVKPVYGVWLAPGHKSSYFVFENCKPISARGWFACVRATW